MKKLFLLSYILFAGFTKTSLGQKKPYLIEDNAKYTYEMISADLDSLNKLFPNNTELFSIGNSEFGMPIQVLRFGTGAPKKRSILFVGNVHAREDYSSKFVMKILNMMLLSYTKDTSVYSKAAQYLEELDMYFMPVANPDGLKIAHENWINIEKYLPEIQKIKRLETYAEWKANGKGVDMNDSFDDGTHAINVSVNASPVPCSEGYKGKIPAEPVETQAIQKFVAQTRPLMTLSFHTKGDIIYWADSKTHHYFNGIDSIIHEQSIAVSNFSRAPVSPKPSTFGGGLENYVRYKFGLLGSCVELSTSDDKRKQYPDNEFNKRVWKKSWKIPVVSIENVIKYTPQLESISEKYRIE